MIQVLLKKNKGIKYHGKTRNDNCILLSDFYFDLNCLIQFTCLLLV